MKKAAGIIPYSDYIDVSEDFVITINRPGQNMQTDAACFEALALVIKARVRLSRHGFPCKARQRAHLAIAFPSSARGTIQTVLRT